MRVLPIKSSEWLRGRNVGSELYNPYIPNNRKNFCCLGLDAKDSGIPHEELRCIGSPEELHSTYIGMSRSETLEAYFERWTTPDQYAHKTGFRVNKELTEEAMHINDDPDTTDEEKIEKLRPIFKQVGIEIDWRPDE